MRALVVVLALSVSTGVLAQQMVQGPARDTRGLATTKGSSRISGVVSTDETVPRPVRRARISVSTPGTPGERTAVTDDNGRFTVADLPAGRYNLAAVKGGYVRMAYGATRPDRPGTQIVLTEGQTMADIAMRLPRGSVIAGTVTDETGGPAVGLQVRVMQYRMQATGERSLTAVAAAGAQQFDTTDDRGAYRIFGLPSGEYVVTVSPRSLGANSEIRAMTEEEMRQALAALQQPPSVGRGSAPGGGRGGPAAPAPATDVVTVGYAPVYYPSTTNAAAAATVTVGIGEERGGIDMAVQLVRTARIEGTIITPAGVSPQSAQVLLLPTGISGTVGLGLNRAAVDANGKFSISGVAPGQYTLSARTGRTTTVMQMAGDTMAFASALEVAGTRVGGGGANAIAGGEPPPSLWGLVEFSVNGRNVTDLSVTMQPGMTLGGQLVFEGLKMAAPKDLSRARVTLSPVATAGGAVTMTGSVQVDPSGRFTVTGLSPGRYRFTANMPPEPGMLGTWTLRSAVAAGRDAIDLPLEIGPNEAISDAVLTFTDATQEVSGMLQDASGRAAPDYTIVVFAADSRFWMPGSRRIRTGRPGTDGRFSVTGLPAGDYRIAAVTDMAPTDATDPAFLQLLVDASVPVALAPGEKRVQDFRIGGRPSQ